MRAASANCMVLRNMADDAVLIRPNRSKTSSKTTRVVVMLLLLVSAALMAIVIFGAWSKLSGLKPVLIAYFLVYLLLAYQVFRWSRGGLTLGAALAIVLAILAAVSVSGWFSRSAPGFATPQSILGSSGLPSEFIGLIVAIIIPVQVLVIVFALQGFSQEWQVEIEVSRDEARRRGEPVVA